MLCCLYSDCLYHDYDKSASEQAATHLCVQCIKTDHIRYLSFPDSGQTYYFAVQIWDLESKSVVDELRLPQDQPLGRKAMQHYCVSVNWSADGATLYGGYTDGVIRVWGIGRAI